MTQTKLIYHFMEQSFFLKRTEKWGCWFPNWCSYREGGGVTEESHLRFVLWIWYPSRISSILGLDIYFSTCKYYFSHRSQNSEVFHLWAHFLPLKAHPSGPPVKALIMSITCVPGAISALSSIIVIVSLPGKVCYDPAFIRCNLPKLRNLDEAVHLFVCQV